MSSGLENPFIAIRNLDAWQVSIWDDAEMLELWDCAPEMVIATENHQHAREEWNGLLNLPSQFKIRSSKEN